MTRSRGFSPPGGSGPGRRRAVALGMVAAMAIGAAACGGSSSGGLSASSAASSLAAADSSPPAAGGLHLPAQLFGLNKNTGPAAKQLARGLRSLSTAMSSLARSPQAALYGTDSTPVVVVIAAKFTKAGARQLAAVADMAKGAAAAIGPARQHRCAIVPGGP